MQAATQDFIWYSEVRSYELDAQGIVNNAHYMHYLDHVRSKHLAAKNIDWVEWHNDGFDLVLFHIDLKIKSPLTPGDKFYVTSQIERSGKLRVIFNQKIFLEDNDKLIAEAVCSTACVSIARQKPVMPEKLAALLFAS